MLGIGYQVLGIMYRYLYIYIYMYQHGYTYRYRSRHLKRHRYRCRYVLDSDTNPGDIGTFVIYPKATGGATRLGTRLRLLAVRLSVLQSSALLWVLMQGLGLYLGSIPLQ